LHGALIEEQAGDEVAAICLVGRPCATARTQVAA
jgi:hypothetical protein